MKSNINKATDNSLDNESLNVSSQNKGAFDHNDSFNFIKVFIEHIKAIFQWFHGKDLSSINNSDFIALGRTDEEKEQIEEMCARVDEEYALLTELRASGLSPEEWIKKKGDEILENCSPEEREEILRVVKEEGVIEVEEQADALDEETDEIQIEQEESKEE